MKLKHRLRQWLWKFGVDISRFHPSIHPLALRRQLFRSFGIEVVLDVGANTGQFALKLRTDTGYSGRIVSFEPLSSAFTALQANARGDRLWEVHNFALGDADGTEELNVAGNSESSSLLAMLPSHRRAAPESAYVGRERVAVRTLDSVFDTIIARPCRIFLKIDTQGAESRVLRGGEKALAGIDTVQLEMSLLPLYEGERPLSEMLSLMEGKGYSLVSLEPGFADEHTGQVLQVDGIFHRLPAGRAARG